MPDTSAVPFAQFASAEIDTGETTLFVRWAGTGPPLLLLHGFPQTHLMWRDVAPLLASDFTVVCADLRGYGASGCPEPAPDHSTYAKRAMAKDLVGLMQKLRFEQFMVAGHDRGGRVAYRLALDHPAHATALALLDILPTKTVWDRIDERFALGYWPWTLLAQDAPFPERLLAAAPEAVIDQALGGWGSPAGVFPEDVRKAYADALRDPRHAHAICEEYRAAATLDRQHDQADEDSGRRIACPVLALWATGGALDTWYADEGGPLALWRRWADDVRGGPVEGGHFFPEEAPGRTAGTLAHFFLNTQATPSA